MKFLGLANFDDVYETILEFSKRKLQLKSGVTSLNITEMDLSENKLDCFFSPEYVQQHSIEKLPKLHSVKTLNILNNLGIENIQDAISQIQMVMPFLTTLSISLSEEDDVSFILNHMQQLEVLNGIRVERSQLFNVTGSCSEDPSNQTY